MKRIEIVTHCYCPPGVDGYARMLAAQCESLLRWKPRATRVTLSVFTTGCDELTLKCVDTWSEQLALENVDLIPYVLHPSDLFRRAIGRNIAARTTSADVVWFTDVDYFFGPGCLDAVTEAVPLEGVDLYCPREVLICRDHATGDELVATGRALDSLDLFVARRQKVAIGGCQIVAGAWARRNGYLHGTRWVKPVSAEQGFRSCKCDRAFRSVNKLRTEHIDAPGVYRLRHTRDGRDYDVNGRKVGRSVW